MLEGFSSSKSRQIRKKPKTSLRVLVTDPSLSAWAGGEDNLSWKWALAHFHRLTTIFCEETVEKLQILNLSPRGNALVSPRKRWRYQIALKPGGGGTSEVTVLDRDCYLVGFLDFKFLGNKEFSIEPFFFSEGSPATKLR